MSSTGPSPGAVTVPLPLPTGRRAVLYAVRNVGDATVDEVAEYLGITVSGARQHLTALVDDGLVAATEPAADRRVRGRPRLTYHATELADAIFPKAYAALTNELLGYLAEEDSNTIDRLFVRRRDERIANAQQRLAPRRTMGAKVDELARILDEDGYLATAERMGRDHFRLIEHNCAITAVARRYGQACSSEIDFIRAVLPDARVERTSHMIDGARHCAYDITRR
jgi:DeoR family suf operon transcriptional repressor